MSEFAAKLKQSCPNAFERFRTGYLKNNFPYWNEDGDVKIWFCELDFRLQYYFFLEYIYQTDYDLLSSVTVKSSLSPFGKKLVEDSINEAFFILERRINKHETGFALNENDKI